MPPRVARFAASPPARFARMRIDGFVKMLLQAKHFYFMV